MAFSIPFTLYNPTNGPWYTKLIAQQPPESNQDGIVLQQPTSGPEGSKLAYRQPRLWISGKLTQNFAQKLAKTRMVCTSSFTLKKTRKRSAKWLIWRQTRSDVKYPYSIYSRNEEPSIYTQSQDTNWSTPLAGLPSTSASVYSCRRCSKAFRALPTIEEGRILYYTVMKYILFEE